MKKTRRSRVSPNSRVLTMMSKRMSSDMVRGAPSAAYGSHLRCFSCAVMVLLGLLHRCLEHLCIRMTAANQCGSEYKYSKPSSSNARSRTRQVDFGTWIVATSKGILILSKDSHLSRRVFHYLSSFRDGASVDIHH